MIGTIYQPSLVICDTLFVSTLPQREFMSGMGEVLKYAISLDSELYRYILKNKDSILTRSDDEEILSHVIFRCGCIKADIVSSDENEETGLRMLLNFGHTVGHAIEASLGYSIPHGFAVALGMIAEAKISDIFQGKKIGDEVESFIRDFGLGHISDLPSGGIGSRIASAFFDILSSMRLDKKTRGDHINVIFLDDIGKSHVESVKIEDFVKVASGVLKSFLDSDLLRLD